VRIVDSAGARLVQQDLFLAEEGLDLYVGAQVKGRLIHYRV
jgi:hypothetical protein